MMTLASKSPIRCTRSSSSSKPPSTIATGPPNSASRARCTISRRFLPRLFSCGPLYNRSLRTKCRALRDTRHQPPSQQQFQLGQSLRGFLIDNKNRCRRRSMQAGRSLAGTPSHPSWGSRPQWCRPACCLVTTPRLCRKGFKPFQKRISTPAPSARPGPGSRW